MPQILIKAPADRVFKAMCDLPSHAKWAAHDIEIKPVKQGPAKVGSEYTSQHKKAKRPDRVTVTEMVADKRFGFHVIMPNKWEMDYAMTTSPQGGGTLVTRQGKMTKLPLMMAPMKLLVPILAGGGDKKFLSKMKADLEARSS
jgi:uncharacterized protein YndB with AHSA1/START domain